MYLNSVNSEIIMAMNNLVKPYLTQIYFIICSEFLCEITVIVG